MKPEFMPLLATLLFVKHFLADGLLQTQYQLNSKRIFLHLGGLSHAATHAGLTAACFAACIWLQQYPGQSKMLALALVAKLCAIEFCLHYLIDWTKCAFDAARGWSENRISESGQRQLVIKNDLFFHAFLADQMMHSLTYVLLLWMAFR